MMKMITHSERPVDVKLKVKPVVALIVHSDAKEGPCRIGTIHILDPKLEKQNNKKICSGFKKGIKNSITGEDVEILEPVCLEYGESLVIPDSQFRKLEADLQQVDLFLWSGRPHGIERFNKPIAVVGGFEDIPAYLRSRGFEAYAPLDYDELNELITLLKVRKAIRDTRMLVVSDEEILTDGVSSNVWDMEELKSRYGISSKRVSFKTFSDQMDHVDRKEAEKLTSQLINRADRVHMSKGAIIKSVIAYIAAKRLMEEYGCNAFTIGCFELCTAKIAAEKEFTPCLTHALLKNEGYPSTCQGDINALLATMLLMYISKKSTYMGNAGIVSREENILEIQHDAGSLKIKGLDKPDLPYEIRHFTKGGWGAVLRYDFSKDKGQEVTIARVDPTATRLLLTRGEIIDGFNEERGCRGLRVHIKIPDIVEFFHKKADFGNHMTMVYGDYTRQIKKLGEIMKFEIVDV
jgi:hypothetical protein